jgi:gliding motility-associated-like protein
VGDLYTAEDGSQGIVFYVAADGGGWAVALHDEQGLFPWSTVTGDISTIPNYSGANQAPLADTSGYANTLAIRNYVGGGSNYAAGVVDFAHGWYLPAASQLALIYAQLPFIQTALSAAGGSLMITDHSGGGGNFTDYVYWSSTEVNSGSACGINFFDDTSFPDFSFAIYAGTPQGRGKQGSARVRAVCSFPPPHNEYDTTLLYVWNTGDTVPHFQIEPEQTTDFSVTVTNAYGCSNSASVGVTVIDIIPQVIYDTTCQGAVYNNYGFSLSAAETVGIEDTTLTRMVSAIGCESEITLQLTILAPDTVEIEEHAGQSFVWNGVTYTEDGVYTQYFNNQYGCDSTVILTLTLDGGVSPEPDTIDGDHEEDVLYLPNAFTPDGNGKNEVFLPVFANMDEIEEYRMEIYNRWGGLVFQTEEKTFGWDGANAIGGVYAVVVHYKFRGEKPKVVKGSVTVVR